MCFGSPIEFGGLIFSKHHRAWALVQQQGSILLLHFFFQRQSQFTALDLWSPSSRSLAHVFSIRARPPLLPGAACAPLARHPAVLPCARESPCAQIFFAARRARLVARWALSGAGIRRPRRGAYCSDPPVTFCFLVVVIPQLAPLMAACANAL